MEHNMNNYPVKSRSIAVMVGLPHLADGVLLRRARQLQQPVLISANALSRWSTKRGWREWAGWTTRPLMNAHGLRSLSLDSAGFSAMVTYGRYPWTVDDYVGLRSEEHTSELQSLMRISYAVFCLKQKTNKNTKTN